MSIDWKELRRLLLEKMEQKLEKLQEDKEDIVDDMIRLLVADVKRHGEDYSKGWRTQSDLQEWIRLEYLNAAFESEIASVASKFLLPNTPE